MKFGRGVLYNRTKKRTSGLFSFFFFSAVPFVQSSRKIKKKTSKCASLSNKRNKKTPLVSFFICHKNDPAKFRFLNLFPSGGKSLRPKCSGSCWNQLVVYSSSTYNMRTIQYTTPKLSRSLVDGACTRPSKV